MKKLYILFLLSFLVKISAQNYPANYYNGTAGLTGAALKTKLSQIITNGHNDMGYGSGDTGLWTCYKTSDVDKYYEKDGTVLDMYSEKPLATDQYEYKFGQQKDGGNQCGNGLNFEGSCYNREHSLPKSYFGGQSATPMANDANFIVPSDYYVNSQRSNYLYGETTSPIKTFSNGTKLGPSSFVGYGGTVLEPINEFKGDFARMWLYFITRYENQLTNFYNLNVIGTPFDGSTLNGYQQWIINLLLKWNDLDPVSQKEIDRNDAVYQYQGNRNPFIDHPEWVHQIWTSTLSLNEINDAQMLTIYPNPVKEKIIYVKGSNIRKIGIVELININGQIIQKWEKPFLYNNFIPINKNILKGVYLLKIDQEPHKIIIE